MILKKLIKNGLITIDYYKNGLLNTCHGYVYKLDLHQQILLIKTKNKKTFSIRLSDIKEIH